jgi:ribosomal protein S14
MIETSPTIFTGFRANLDELRANNARFRASCDALSAIYSILSHRTFQRHILTTDYRCVLWYKKTSHGVGLRGFALCRNVLRDFALTVLMCGVRTAFLRIGLLFMGGGNAASSALLTLIYLTPCLSLDLHYIFIHWTSSSQIEQP